MIFLNKESIYVNGLAKQPKVDWQERKYSKCPLCPADISDENVSSAQAKKWPHLRDSFATNTNLSIPATLLNGGILNIARCGFPGLQKNSDKLQFKARNNKTSETFKTCRHKRVIEPDAMLGPKRTFPCSGCPINMLPFTVKCENDHTTSFRKRRFSKNSNDENRSVFKSASVGSRVSGKKAKRRQIKILETNEPDPKKTESSFSRSRTRSSSRSTDRLKRHHSLLTVRKRRRRLSAQVQSSKSVETQVSFTKEENYQNSIHRANNRSSKNILNCTYENKSSQIEDEIPLVMEPPSSFTDSISNKAQQSIDQEVPSSENPRDYSTADNSTSVQTDSNQSASNVTVNNDEKQLENQELINEFKSGNNSNGENTNDSLHLRCSGDLSVEEQTRYKNSFDQNAQGVDSTNALEWSVQELHLKNSVDQQDECSMRSEIHTLQEGFIKSITLRNNYIDDAFIKAKTHDFLHEFYQELGKEEYEGGMLDDDSDDDLNQKSDDQLIIIDSSASDVHEDNPILSDDEKRAIMEEMVGPRINYFKFDSETDNEDLSPCGKYLNKLPQVFRIKTNGDLKKFEIENIVRQYRYSYLVRIMNKCPKPDLRLRRCRRSDRTERFYIDSSIKKKRLMGRSEHSRLQQGSSRRIVKRSTLSEKRMRRELGPATIWNGPSPSRRKLEAPKFCQTLDYNVLFEVPLDEKQTNRLQGTPPLMVRGSKEGLFDSQSTLQQNKQQIKNPISLEEIWNLWEMDCVKQYLKNFSTTGDNEELCQSKINLPKPSDTKGKSCPFSPWPCPLGPICPFPPTNNLNEDDKGKCNEAGSCQHIKIGCSSKSDFAVLSDVPDIIKEMANLTDPSILPTGSIPKHPWLSENNVKKVKSSINKVSIGTVTSCECVVLPKCKIFKRKKEEMPNNYNVKPKRRLGDKRQSKSEQNIAKKLTKCWYKSRRDNTYQALRLPACEGYISNNYHVSPYNTHINKMHPSGRKFARRNRTWKEADDLLKLRRSRCSSDDMIKLQRDKYISSARRIKHLTLNDYEGYPQTECPTEDYSESQHCWDISSDERIHSSRETPMSFRKKNSNFLIPGKNISKYNTNETSVLPLRYKRSSSSEFKRAHREFESTVKSYEPRKPSKRYVFNAHSYNNLLKRRNREYHRSNSSHLLKNDFFNELSFYADPQFPKPNFISYNTSLYHRRSHISCLPPSIASKIILNKDKCAFKNNPVLLSERTNTCASYKGQDQSWVKRASGRHVPHNVDYF